MNAGGVWSSRLLRRTFCGASLLLCLASFVGICAAQATSGARRENAPSQDAGQGEYEDIAINVPNIVAAGKILRDVVLLKAQEGFPTGDGEPRFDAENNKLYFRTSAQNAAAMKRMLAKIESGAAMPSKLAELKPISKASTQFYAIEIWLVQLQLPKGESVELGGPRAEMLTVLGGLEKDSKAEVLNHIYLMAEEHRIAQAMQNESVVVINGVNVGPPGRQESDAGKAPVRPVNASITRELIGTQVKLTPGAVDGQTLLLEYSVSKSYLSKAEEGSLIPTDSTGGGYKQPNTRLFEVESSVRAKLGSVLTASSQSRGGEKPLEIRVLILVNPL